MRHGKINHETLRTRLLAGDTYAEAGRAAGYTGKAGNVAISVWKHLKNNPKFVRDLKKAGWKRGARKPVPTAAPNAAPSFSSATEESVYRATVASYRDQLVARIHEAEMAIRALDDAEAHASRILAGTNGKTEAGK